MRPLTAGALCLAVLSCAPCIAHAGGWTQPEGHSYTKLWTTATIGGAAFDLDGEVRESDSYTLLRLSAYAEYGLRPDLTLVARALPLGYARYGDADIGYTGEWVIGLRQRLVSKPLQIAVEGRVGANPGFGDRDLAAGGEFTFQPTASTSFVEWEMQLGVPIGTVGWVAASLGPHLTGSSSLSSKLLGFAQVGFGPFAGFVVDLHFNLNHTFTAPALANITGATDTRYVGFGLGASWWASRHFALNVSAEGALFAVANAATPALSFGVEFRTF